MKAVEECLSENNLLDQPSSSIHPYQYYFQFPAPVLYINERTTLPSLIKAFPKYHAQLYFQLHQQNFADCPSYRLRHVKLINSYRATSLMQEKAMCELFFFLFFFLISKDNLQKYACSSTSIPLWTEQESKEPKKDS